MYKQQIIQNARNRGIMYLIHFTCVDNIESILKKGLLTRKELVDDEIEFDYNDPERLDGVKDSVSLSVTWPNYKMFWPLRCDYPEKEWVVLKLNMEKVLEMNCAYCYRNAASSEITIIALKDRCTYEAYTSLFDNEHTKHTREEMNLTDDEPTNPQAEILVLDSIPVEYIEYAFFQDKTIYDKHKDKFKSSNINVWYDRGIYYARHDNRFW